MPEIRKCPAGHEYWFPGESWKHEECVEDVANSDVANESVANSVSNTVANKSVGALRVKLWRQANRERYNARERERMRKKRALSAKSG